MLSSELHSSSTTTTSMTTIRLVQPDDDGDLDVPRRSSDSTAAKNTDVASWTLSHRSTTALDQVGLQLWRGALLLADHVLDGQLDPLLSNDAGKGLTFMELGAGVGLVSLVLQHRYPTSSVYATDVGVDVLDNMLANVTSTSSAAAGPAIHVRWFDWGDPFIVPAHVPLRHHWTEGDKRAVQDEVDVFLAADVVYDDEATVQLVRAIDRLLVTKRKRLVMALEKRYVFTVAALATVAPALDRFETELRRYGGLVMERVEPLPRQWLLQYERTNELYLYMISRK